MNLFKKATTTFILGLMTLASYSVYAGVDEIPGSEEFRDASVQVVGGDSTIEKASNASKSVLSTAKVILNGLAVIYIVYVGIMMVIAYGDE